MPAAPRLDERRTAEFRAELRERASAWIPTWDLTEGEGDFGGALLELAARFSSEVAERLDGAGEKMRRGFLDWLAVKGEAARPARMPVVFKLADTAREAVLASAPVRLQADAAGTPVVFETEKDVRVVPGRLEVVVGADAAGDAFYLPPPGLSELVPPEPLPVQWQTKSFAAVGATKLQLDPESGLVAEMILDAGGEHYRIVAVDKEIVTIDPPLTRELDAGAILKKVTGFEPFDGPARNRQEHALYLGHADLLNIEAAATLEIVGAAGLVAGVTWQYWGRVDPKDDVGWQPLTPALEQTAPDAIILSKPKGALEPREINGKSSRWIRAFAKTVGASEKPFTTDEFSIRLNACDCDCSPEHEVASPAAEGMANTTPLVLESVFFPLGKEPRQFDAFYLGSQEAFSKPGAKVTLCFEMADPTFAALSVVREGASANAVLTGVGQDRALHLLAFEAESGAIARFLGRDALQPPLPGYRGNAESGTAIPLDRRPRWPLPVWSEAAAASAPDEGFLVATAAEGQVWVWREHPDPKNSGWIHLGEVPGNAQTPSKTVDGLVYLGGNAAKLVALRGGRLFVREWPNGTEWELVDTLDGTESVALKSIAPVLVRNTAGRLVTSETKGMVGISDNRKLFEVSSAGACTARRPTSNFSASVAPVAVEVSAGNVISCALKDSSTPELETNAPAGSENLLLGGSLVGALEVVVSGGTLHILAAVHKGGGSSLVTWAPYETGAAGTMVESVIFSPGGGDIGGGPTALDAHVVVAGARADVVVNEFDPWLRHVKSADVKIGIVVPDSVAALAVNDLIVRAHGASPEPEARKVTKTGWTKDGETFYPIESDFPVGSTRLYAYQLAAGLAGTFASPDQLTLDVQDLETTEGTTSWVRIGTEFYEVTAVDRTNPVGVATIATTNASAPMPASGAVTYVRPIATGGRVAPFMELDPSGNGDWDAKLLNRLPLIFPDSTPHEQRGKAFSLALGNKPVVVVLGAPFQSLTTPAEFLLDAAFGEWHRELGDTSTNPELSWEYWNGKGWWRLGVTRDETGHLKATGKLQFAIPPDLASSDWAGKTNHWIRARLIGGDYGQEKVTVETEKQDETHSKQIVHRSSEGIRAPAVLKLHICYGVCDGMPPTFVLAEDSGSTRDESDANRTAGAIVEAFVPLAVTLGRLSNAAPGAALADSCPADCKCKGTPAASDADDPPSGGAAVVGGRALFLGLNATLSGAPVNVLLLVEERRHTSFAPLTIEALTADRFVPIVANDVTRALGESGVLSMAFAVPPTPRELFGKTLTWLRLAPAAGVDATNWRPAVRGAYLNAVWASATETLTRELVGSSDGSPDLTLKLARPPVLRHTLELRVREPLGEEERDALRREDAQLVSSGVEDLPGDWVLWRQVVDPEDEPAAARVYALDEASGEIRFGNGLHGAIPPIGSDSIVAFSYQRTEAAPADSDSTPANRVAARTQLNLVSSVESVESVIAADQAAGGAPPESAERVLRFGFARLRHRERAVTAQDIEDLALQSSPEIVQARAFLLRGRIRLVLVMQGRDPQPSAARVRELRRLLLAAAPTSLSAPDALRIQGPSLRRLRVELRLRVESIDDAGTLARAAKERLARLFDTASGGMEGEGWQLGANPSGDDIAFALLGAPHLDSIEQVSLFENSADGSAQPWPEVLRPSELVQLADDPVRIQFEPSEVSA